MSTHPTDEVLFAHAETPDPSIAEHLRSCEECAVRARRLEGGALLLAEAREERPSIPDWSRLDAVILRAANEAAQNAKTAQARRPSVVSTSWMYAGGLLAAAAAAVFFVRGTGSSSSQHTTQVSVPSNPSVVRDTTVAEGSVLLFAAPVTYVSPDGQASLLSRQTRVRSGGRVRVAPAGRAVLSMPSVRVDARADSEVVFARVTAGETRMELTKGTVRVDNTNTSEREVRVAMAVSGWELVSKNGAFVAESLADRVRVRVVRGKLGVSRGRGAEREVLAGDEFELAKDGGELRVVSHSATDAMELSSSLLADAEAGREVVLPTAAPAVVAAVNPPAAPSVPAAPALNVVRVHDRVAPRARVEPVAPARVEEPVPTLPEVQDAGEARRAVGRLLMTRAERCIQACAGQCGTGPYFVALDTEADGSISDVRVSGLSGSAGVCVAAEARRLHVPRVLSASAVQLTLQR